jgi:preprotein translocase SecE subunit
MKKVNWSTRREIVGSTVAVITTAVILALFCWVLEIVFVGLAAVVLGLLLLMLASFAAPHLLRWAL